MRLGFIKKSFSHNTLNVNSLKCIPLNNQECKKRSEIINVNTNEPAFYPYSITINKFEGSCNTINAKILSMVKYVFLILLIT